MYSFKQYSRWLDNSGSGTSISNKECLFFFFIGVTLLINSKVPNYVTAYEWFSDSAILIDGWMLVVANVWDPRAVIYNSGICKQLSVDYGPSKEKRMIENLGGFVSNFWGFLRVFSKIEFCETQKFLHLNEFICWIMSW